jgi:hypothetical protein
MLQPPVEEALVLILNAFKERMAPIYLHLAPPTRTNENPTKIYKI